MIDRSRAKVKKAIVPLIAIVLLHGCADYTRHPVSETAFLLGTTCTVTLYQQAPDGVFAGVFDLVRGIESRMSVNLSASEVSTVNRAAGEKPVRVSQDTYTVVATGLEYCRLSEGAFDITVGPLVQLWGIGTERARVPAPQEIRSALALLGWREVVLNEGERSVFLKRKGMALDLGGIAKGYAADAAAQYLSRRGVRHALIDFGGNIMALGNRGQGGKWRIGIQNPSKPRGAYLGILEVCDEAVATSGSYERFFEQNGVRYHHILDTASGGPVGNGVVSATIVTRRSIIADALSTSVFALGIGKGLGLAESLSGVEAVVIQEDGAVFTTPGLKGRFRLTDPGFRLASSP